jgi:hypothetical protein
MPRIADVAQSAAAAETERRLVELRNDRDKWKGLHSRLVAEVADLEDRLATVQALSDARLDPPKWVAPKRVKKHEAIVTAILSDCHWDEVVNAAEIGGVNAYDRHIATVRLRRWAERLVEQCTTYVHGVDVTGAVVMLGGDMLTGTLHDLAESNADHVPGSLVYWSEMLAAALTTIADGLDAPVHCPLVVGNHGRLTVKPRTKGRARDNYDWLIGHMTAAHLAADPRITFSIGDDPDAFVQVFDTTYLLTHGDQAKGGGGIGGIWPPIMRLAARKKQRYQCDFTMVIGHWHQLIMAPAQGLIVNGSTKGYDEFASVCNFMPERPQQAAWLTTPEHGPTLQIPIFCDDREAEGW